MAANVKSTRRSVAAWFTIVLTAFSVVYVIDEVYNFRFFTWMQPSGWTYYFVLTGIYVSLTFLLFPARKGSKRIYWFDWLLFATGLAAFVYGGMLTSKFAYGAWSWLTAPGFTTWIGLFIWVALLESARRTSGLSLTIVMGIFSIYPLFARWMPGPFEGYSFGILPLARFHIFGGSSVFGMIMPPVTQTLFGFLVFTGLLMVTGAGKFFIDLSFGLLGHRRGGPAQVSVLSSGFMGMFSGSTVANVVTTGCFTIPAMKKVGYKPELAAGVEAVASTGGQIMPPVMGTAAFLIAAFLGMSYAEVSLKAFVPAFMYYFALLAYVDFRAASSGLRGLNRSELIPVKKTLKEGWFYIAIMVILIYFLFYLRVEGQAPFYAMAVLIILLMLRKSTRPTRKTWLDYLETLGKLQCTLFTICGAIGLLIGAFSVTGIGSSISREIVQLGGGNTGLIIVLGGIASFLLGGGMPVLPVYIFLAITFVPTLTLMGIDPFAAHLFVMYTACYSNFTPPVAIGAYVAAPIAGASFMKTAWEAMKIGAPIFLIPFAFISNPAIVLDGPLPMLAWGVAGFVLGATLVVGSMHGYLPKINTLPLISRVLCFAGGVLLILGGTVSLIGAGVGLVAVLLAVVVGVARKRARAAPA